MGKWWAACTVLVEDEPSCARLGRGEFAARSPVGRVALAAAARLCAVSTQTRACTWHASCWPPAPPCDVTGRVKYFEIFGRKTVFMQAGFMARNGPDKCHQLCDGRVQA